MTTMEGPSDVMHQAYDFMKMNQPETAKNVHVYLNGDRYYPGRKFVVNRRYIPDFTGFLNQVTMGIKAPFGAVRNIYTPQAGHRVSDLDQLRSGMHVVAGGVEKFRKLDYEEIGARKRPKPKRNYLDIKIHNRMNVSARWRKYVKDPCQIYVYGNGDMNAPALKLLLIPRMMKTWDLVLEEITEKISFRTGQAVRKLYDMDYRLLGDPSELENGQYYVAVGTEKLKKYPYGENQKQNSPRKITSHQPLPPIKRASKTKPPVPIHEDGDKTYTRMYAQKKQHKTQAEEEETVMGASAATGHKPLKAKISKPEKPTPRGPGNESDSVFFGKPVKVKRSGGRAPAAPPPTSFDPHPPYEEEADGVYKQKTRGIRAAEVDEAQDIKVDLPIDQIPADVVDEEHIQPSPRSEERASRMENLRQASPSRERSGSRDRSASREKTFKSSTPDGRISPVASKVDQSNQPSPTHFLSYDKPEDEHQTGDDARKINDALITPTDIPRSASGEPIAPSPLGVMDNDENLSVTSTAKGVSALLTTPQEAASAVEIEIESPSSASMIDAAREHREQEEETQIVSILRSPEIASDKKSVTVSEQRTRVSSRPATKSPEKKSEALSDHIASALSHTPDETRSPSQSETISEQKTTESSRPESPVQKSEAETTSTPNVISLPDLSPQHLTDETKPSSVDRHLSALSHGNSSQIDQSATEETSANRDDQIEDTSNQKTPSTSLTIDDSTTVKEKNSSDNTKAFSEPKSASCGPDDSKTTSDERVAQVHPSASPETTSLTPASTGREIDSLKSSTPNEEFVSPMTKSASNSPSLNYDPTSNGSPFQKHNTSQNGSIQGKLLSPQN